MSSDNPFQAPDADVTPRADPGSEAEQIRRAHLFTEALILAASIPLLLAGGVLALFGAVSLIAIAPHGAEPVQFAIGWGLLVGGGSLLTAAVGLRRFQPWARNVSLAVLSIGGVAYAWLAARGGGYVPVALIGLLAFAAAGVLAHPKARRVFTPAYREIRQTTPHLVYRSSPWVWLAFAAVLLGLVGLGAWFWR